MSLQNHNKKTVLYREGMNYLMDGNLAMADHIVWETELGNSIGMDIVTYMEQHGVSRIEAEKAILPLYEEELKALANKSQ